MTDLAPTRILIIRDGESFFMHHLADGQNPVHVAFMDMAEMDENDQTPIRPLIPGQGTDAQFDTLLTLAGHRMDEYVQSGNFDRDRENQRLRQENAALRSKVDSDAPMLKVVE